jgi:ketosteroid isomerase-like protein
MRHTIALVLVLVGLTGVRAVQCQTNDELARQVRAAERAFAATMAARDRAAFASFVADDAIFFGAQGALRGKAAVLASWARLFEGEKAPFSWDPDTAEVLDSGTLAITSGPVKGPDGRQIGTFNSIWRRDADGRWRVIFDKGCS